MLYTVVQSKFNSLFTLQVNGDGTNATLNVPLGLLPLELPVGRKENNPAAVTVSNEIPQTAVTGTLSPDGTVLQLTFSPVLADKAEAVVDVSLLYAGV